MTEEQAIKRIEGALRSLGVQFPRPAAHTAWNEIKAIAQEDKRHHVEARTLLSPSEGHSDANVLLMDMDTIKATHRSQ